MTVTYDSLKALSRQTMKDLLNVQSWQKFLAFACRSLSCRSRPRCWPMPSAPRPPP